MGRMYVVEFADVAVAAAQDLFSLLPAVDKPVKLHAVFLSQSTEVGDAAEESLTLKLQRGATTTGSGGSAAAGEPLISVNDAADAATIRVNDTTEASSGTIVDLHSESWNIRTPFIWLPPPEHRPMVENAAFFTVVLITIPADSITMTGTLIYEEVV